MVHFDFEFLLLISTTLCGLGWLVDSLFFKKQRHAGVKKTITGKPIPSKLPPDPILVEYAKSFFPVLLVVLVMRAFLYEPFRIPSGSMMPTLLVGDFVLVNKYAYGLRLPVWHNKITEGDKPARGDVAVFRFPGNESVDYIKRIIGLPGDHVSFYNRRVSINGKVLSLTKKHFYKGLGNSNEMLYASGCDRVGARCLVFNENIGSANYSVMIDPMGNERNPGELFVPEGHFLVLGDNRDNSNDSRYWGFVPEKNLVGKAVLVWMHWDFRTSGTGLDLSRAGTKI